MASSTRTTSAKKAKKNILPVLIRCYAYLRPYWRLVGGVYLTVLGINGLNVVIPQFIRWIVDKGIIEQNFVLMGWSVAGLLIGTVIKGLFTFFQGIWSETASQYVAYDFRNAIQSKLTVLSFSFHDRTEAGQILSRAMQDVERIRFLTGRAVLRILDSVLLMVGTAGVLIWMNPRLGLLALFSLPLLAYRAYVFGRAIRPLSIRVQNQLGVLTTRLEQNLRGIRVVKAFAQEDNEIERFLKENEKWFDLSARAVRLEALNAPLLDFLGNLGTVVVLWYGGTLVIQGQITIGELVAFTTYLTQLYRPVRVIGRVIPALAIAASAGDRIFEILDAHSDVEDRPGAVPLPKVEGHVVFDHVSFGYRDGQQTLKDVSFEARPGDVVALLGPTGSGKTTIINLVSRFYEPTAGQVFIDGYNTRDVQLVTLRNQIGIVLQDTTLFAASVRENIAFARPDVTEEELVAVAKAAQVHEFVVDMPRGYDTRIGERGITLSGGQKQRVAIARALVSNPRILILDDATASVDTQTEGKIQKALDVLMEGRTTFVIAHRLSTVRRANLILVLDHGRVTAQGTHEELLRSSKVYEEIYQLQLRPQEMEDLARLG